MRLVRNAALGYAILATHVVAELAVYPPEIDLSGARDTQTFVVQRTLETGETIDVTDEATVTLDGDACCELAKGTLAPESDGVATLRVEHSGDAVEAAVSVTDTATDAPISLRLDVMPIFMQAGCNSGKCHGSARGQDGFGLSLFGFDVAGDYFRLLKEMPGRRVNVARPEASLLLTKAIGQAPHTGGKRFDTQSEAYATLLRWIREGAADDPDDIAEPTGIEVYPPSAVLVGAGKTHRLTVRATYSDGSTRDVTRQALYLSNNDSSASVSEDGVITAGARGEAFVMARFATFTEGAPVIVLPADAAPAAEMPQAPTAIDRVVFEKLRKLRIRPSDRCSDEAFLRRVSLDLTGLTPTRERYEAFLADESPTKRADLIDELLDSDAFTDVWAMRFGELLRIRTSNQVSYKALLGFHTWVRDQIAENRPLDKMMADVLRAEGGTFAEPATNYYQIEANTLQLAENVAQSFLGMRVQCAQCHNHPFDRWTMDDYYGFAAFFSQVGFKQSRDPREFVVYERETGEMDHIVTGEPAEPTYLGGGSADVGDRTRREALAEWIVSEDSPGFARNLANIIWAHHFGRGVIEPVDDVRISNPPSNGPLLDLLADQLRENGYDLRGLVRSICNSHTYQLSTQSNETNKDDLAYFSKAPVRRLRAESLLDSISLVTETDERLPRLPMGARAVQLADGASSNYFLTTFGRAPRETVCACEVDVEPNLSQAFHLLNGDATNDKVVAGDVVGDLIAQGQTPAEVIDHLYIACYSRQPTDRERSQLLATLGDGDPKERLNDIFWALLNSKEFLFNH